MATSTATPSSELRPTRTLATALVSVGLLWALVAAYVFLVMSGMSLPIYPLPIILLLYFGGPAVLVVGSAIVMYSRHRMLGSIAALAACVWLTILVGPDLIATFLPREPLQSRPPYELFACLGIIILLADSAAVVLLRRVAAI